MQAELLKSKCDQGNLEKLASFKNPTIISFIEKYIKLTNPKSAFIRTDSLDDALYIREKAIENGEELPLAMQGHTVHFDGYFDQARDKKATKYLLPKEKKLGKNINAIERTTGIEEVTSFLKESMHGKEMIVCFFGLGPVDSQFFIPCVQLTDSYYVAHSEGILYRSAFDAIMQLSPKKEFFKFVHTAGELENSVSKNIDKRRVYIDLEENIVYSTNTQYAGNTVGLKKLALRLAIQKASREGWLAEHMFVSGIKGPQNRITYFIGAYPSACGKTSTAMIKGESIIGDDIAYLRKINSSVRAVNVECGIFGIIRDVSAGADPLIWKALNTPGEAIFTNILIDDQKKPYWLGSGIGHPSKGTNFSGAWYEGKLDDTHQEIPYAHKNARYTVSLHRLENCDANLDNPEGVRVGAVIYGGRDSDTWPPLQQSFDWAHGVITMGASLESETTAATLGKEGVRTFNLMSNLDFLSIPLGTYINNHLTFIEGLESIPLIFGVNYFQRDKEGAYLTGMEDKRVWLKWMELRVHNEVQALATPTGFIPVYHDLKELFKQHLDKNYTSDDYTRQFTLRIPENLNKIERILNIYEGNSEGIPQKLFTVLHQQQQRLIDFQKIHGDYVDPFTIERLT